MTACYEQWRREGTLLHLVIADRVSDAYLGEVMAALTDDRVAELGAGVVPAARGHGVATEAVRLLAEWALGTLELGRLQVLVAPENLPALRVAEGAGFRREGLLRAYWEIDGSRCDVVILSRLPDDS